MPPALSRLYSSCENGNRQPDHNMLLNAIHHIMKELVEAYIVIDAVDECKMTDELIATLSELNGLEGVKMHILATARRDLNMIAFNSTISSHQVEFCIRGSLIGADIQAYVQFRIQEECHDQRILNQAALLQEIEARIIEKADGM